MTNARITINDGLPLLQLDGRATPPVVFFFNTEVPNGQHFLEPQVRRAAAAGVHIQSMPIPWPWPGEDEDAIHAQAGEILDRFLAVDPDALFIPRLRCEGGEAWLADNPGERVLFEDGTRAMMSSLASAEWWRLLQEGLSRAIRRLESSRHGDRIIGYHPSGQTTGEWFHYEYWMHGPDYSAHNQEAFRAFLAARHGDDAGLSRAWGRDASIATAAIPRGWRRTGSYQHFHDPATEQDRLDFLEFTNEIVPARLAGIARVVKQAVEHRKLMLAFYGYTMELKGSSHGHLGLGAVLRDPAIDTLCSPLSYNERGVGGFSGFMAPVDSLPLHGKMWIIEDDSRTHHWTGERLPPFIPPQDVGPICKDSAQSTAVLQRTAATSLAHGVGVWWMDLVSVGAFDDDGVWDFMRGEFLPAWQRRLDAPRHKPADVAIIVDEASLRTLREDFPGCDTAMNELSHQALFLNRDAFMRCGARVGFYLLQDLLDGLVPDAAAHVFPCCWNMAPGERARLASWWRARERGHALWLFSAGLPPGLDGAEVALHELAGIDARVARRPAGTMDGRGALAGLRWGAALSTGPSWALANHAGMEALAVDAATGEVACARRVIAPRKSSTLLANPAISWQALGALLDLLGVPRLARDGQAMSCDGTTLSLHDRHGATTWQPVDTTEASAR